MVSLVNCEIVTHTKLNVSHSYTILGKANQLYRVIHILNHTLTGINQVQNFATKINVNYGSHNESHVY